MKIRLLWMPIMLVVALFMASCNSSDDDLQTDNTYVYEGEGFGGNFSITINKDGTFSFYEGMLSSYIGHGKWQTEHGVLTISDGTLTNRFIMFDNELVFIEEGSSNFFHIKLKGGDKFIKSDCSEGITAD